MIYYLPLQVDSVNAGSDGGRVWAAVDDQPLDRAALEGMVSRQDAGAVVSFAGVVRNHDHGREIVELEYLAHPNASAVLAALAAEAVNWPQVLAVAVAHRTGRLAIGDTAIVAAISAAHRADAFTACQRLVDEVKVRLPVWKRQSFADGDHEWVGCA